MKTDSPLSSELKTARQNRIARKEKIAQDKAHARRWSERRRVKSRMLAVAQAIKVNMEQVAHSATDQPLVVARALNTNVDQ